MRRTSRLSAANGTRPAPGRTAPIPGVNAKVLIPQHIAVTLDSVETSPLKTVRVDGTLTFATNVTTRLMVDTLVVDATGSLIVGTAANPVANDVTAKIVIVGNGPIEHHVGPAAVQPRRDLARQFPDARRGNDLVRRPG